MNKKYSNPSENANEVINNQNSNEMKEQNKAVATQNAAENESVTINNETMKKEETKRTWKVTINDEVQDIIVAFTDYNMELPKKKHDLFKLVDEKNLLPVMYNLASPDIFWKESYILTDCEGYEIEKGTPNVYVLCPEPETNCRIFFDEVLEDVSIHNFESVQDWAKAVGTTNQLSLSFNKVKEVGVASVAVGDKAAKEIFSFAIKNKVNNTIAEIFLDTRLTPQTVSKMMLGHKPKMELTLGRTPEQAQELYDQCCLTFGEGETKKRYVGRAVSSILKQEKYCFDLVMEALRTIPASDVAYAKLMDCGAKEACIMGTLITWMIGLQRHDSVGMAA